MKLVEVTWVDSHILGDRWVSPDDVASEKLAICRTAGYLVRDDSDMLVVAQTLGPRSDGTVEEYGQPIAIPRAALLVAPVELLRYADNRLPVEPLHG